ncbi:MAG: FG-GAP-like repeat-containing protein, partial [Bacteroidota bacterium]
MFLSCVAFIPGRDIQDRLYLNDGDGFFTDVTATHLPPATIHTLDGVFDDADGDGDLDLFTVGLDLVGEKSPVRAFLNNGQGVFTEATETVLGDLYPIRGLGILIADLNRDSLNDIYACDRKTLTDNTKDVLLT